MSDINSDLPAILLDTREERPYLYKPEDRDLVVCMLDGDRDEAERYGRLFAAAPMMLAALRSIADAPTPVDLASLIGSLAAAKATAGEAIEAAKGGQS